MPAPLRVPTVTVVDSWPNLRSGGINRILWQEDGGRTLYGYGADASLYKSTNKGSTWQHRAYLNFAPFRYDTFLKTSTGTLLTIAGSSGSVRRSTDDGKTWTAVHNVADALGPQSWCLDKSNGDIYYGEYAPNGSDTSNLWRSTDDGETWTVFHAFPKQEAAPDRIIHIHAVQWDHVTQRVWVCTGDSTPGTGLYRVSDDRTGVIPMVTNAMLPGGSWPNGFFDAPRAIGIMPFDDYIAWASDSTNNPGLFRVSRAELGTANPTVERIYRTNSTNWFTAKASADGSRWVFSSSQEARSTHAIDKQVHLYAVEDQGATVYEVATLPQIGDTLPAGSLQPIGLPEDQGDVFFLQARTTGQGGAWAIRLGDAAGSRLEYPQAMPVVAAWKTVTSGVISIDPAGTILLHGESAASFARTLRIFDANVISTDGSAGRLRIEVVDSVDATVYYGYASPGARQGGRQEWSPFIAEALVPANRIIHFQALNSHAGEAVEGMAAITFGWGN